MQDHDHSMVRVDYPETTTVFNESVYYDEGEQAQCYLTDETNTTLSYQGFKILTKISLIWKNRFQLNKSYRLGTKQDCCVCSENNNCFPHNFVIIRSINIGQNGLNFTQFLNPERGGQTDKQTMFFLLWDGHWPKCSMNSDCCVCRVSLLVGMDNQ